MYSHLNSSTWRLLWVKKLHSYFYVSNYKVRLGSSVTPHAYFLCVNILKDVSHKYSVSFCNLLITAPKHSYPVACEHNTGSPLSEPLLFIIIIVREGKTLHNFCFIKTRFWLLLKTVPTGSHSLLLWECNRTKQLPEGISLLNTQPTIQLWWQTTHEQSIGIYS